MVTKLIHIFKKIHLLLHLDFDILAIQSTNLSFCFISFYSFFSFGLEALICELKSWILKPMSSLYSYLYLVLVMLDLPCLTWSHRYLMSISFSTGNNLNLNYFIFPWCNCTIHIKFFSRPFYGHFLSLSWIG